MSNYFSNFPTVKHTGENLVDITRRADIFSFMDDDSNLFIPYHVTEDMRPEEVAFYYYGSQECVWLVYLANEIIDPYSDWVKPQDELDAYIAKRYAGQSGKSTAVEVLDWTKNTQITDNVAYYRNKEDDDHVVSRDTYLYGPALVEGFEAAEWEPIRFYEYEFEKNEMKRNINLVNKTYQEAIRLELDKTLNG